MILFILDAVTSLAWAWRPEPVIAATSVLIGAGFGLLTLAHSAILLAAAVTAWSVGELAQWPVAAAYTTSLAPPGMTAGYAGARSLCYGTALLLAPLAGTALYRLSPTLLWGTCATAGICAAAVITPWPLVPPRCRRLARPRRPGNSRGTGISITAPQHQGPLAERGDPASSPTIPPRGASRSNLTNHQGGSHD
jgi:MFS family permease